MTKVEEGKFERRYPGGFNFIKPFKHIIGYEVFFFPFKVD